MGAVRATPENWMCPPADGWAYDQVSELVLQFDWELVDGGIAVREMTDWWHDQVRDRLFLALMNARTMPLAVNIDRAVAIDERNVVKSGIVVFDKQGLDVLTLDCIPVERVVLAVEVTSPGTRTSDHFLKPGLYIEAGAAYWRIGRDGDSLPEAHLYRWHREKGFCTPHSECRGSTLKTDVPFPVEIDLRSLIEV
ncbi:Uma2 family endonuclease [Streptomyces roseoverticillatus]|uniref:Uma2 family endonuclease n=1 Tax=Streptomyces roseoverticillatus TaxID=66429 RepID=UPI001FE1B3C3|nr:Uma2 family endonuclease [Streptomyces roseoverticillatus]